jgi:hypothetical protein
MWGGGGSGAEQEVIQNVSEILNQVRGDRGNE